MKTDKAITTVLLLASIVIWGLIIFRLVKLNRSGAESSIQTAPHRQTETDTSRVQLMLDYPDPFLKPLESPVRQPASIHAPPSRPKTPEPAAPGFRFHGIISNEASTFGLIGEKEKMRLVEIGDTVCGFTVSELSTDIIMLGKNGKNIELKSE